LLLSRGSNEPLCQRSRCVPVDDKVNENTSTRRRPKAREAQSFPGLFVFMLLPLFLNVAGRRVLLVGGGPVAASKLRQLMDAGADVQVVAPSVVEEIERAGVRIARREFVAGDLDEVWLVVAAATPAVNRAVAEAAGIRRVFVNAVDDPSNATAFMSGIVRRDRVTLAISTDGEAPGLTALLREAFDHLLPRDLARWVDEARLQRAVWRRRRVPMAARRPLLLAALNRLYELGSTDQFDVPGSQDQRRSSGAGDRGSSGDLPESENRSAAELRYVPWLSAPEDSWL